MPGISPRPFEIIFREEERRCMLYEPKTTFVVEAQKLVQLDLRAQNAEAFRNCKVTLTLLRKPPYQDIPVHACIKPDHQIGSHPKAPITFAEVEAEMEHSVNNEGHHSIACRLPNKMSFFIKFTCSGFEQRGLEGTLWMLRCRIDYTSPLTNGVVHITEGLPMICVHRMARVQIADLFQRITNTYNLRISGQDHPEQEREANETSRIVAATFGTRGRSLIRQARGLQQTLDQFAGQVARYYERHGEFNVQGEDVSSGDDEEEGIIVINDENASEDELDLPNLVPIEQER